MAPRKSLSKLGGGGPRHISCRTVLGQAPQTPRKHEKADALPGCMKKQTRYLAMKKQTHEKADALLGCVICEECDVFRAA